MPSTSSPLPPNCQESALVIFVVQLEAQFVAVERHAFLDITYGKHYRVNVINHNSEATDSCYKRLTSTRRRIGRPDHYSSMRCRVIPDYLAILHHKSDALEFCNIVGVSIRRALLVAAMGWADPLRGVSEGFQPDWGRFCQTSRMDGMILFRILSRRLRVREPKAYRHGSQNDGRTSSFPLQSALQSLRSSR